jgi:hypothetical protein
MSIYGINVPAPDEINYHEAREQQRVEAAKKRIDPGDVIAIVESRLSQESDPKTHPLYNLVCWVLDQHVAPLDGGQLFDRWHQLVPAAVDSAIDDALEAMEG